METLRSNCEICEQEFDTKVLKQFKGYKQLCSSCLVDEIKSLVELQKVAAVSNSSEQSPTVDNPQPSARIETERDSGTFQTRDEFWNAENTALDNITGTPFERYQKIALRLTNNQEILFQAQQSIAADYVRLQSLKVDLTNEERKALKITYTDYQPGELNAANVKPTVAKKPRQSADEKAAHSIAEAIYKKEIKLGESIQSALCKEHPEYYLNGYIREQFRELRDNLFREKGALTLEQAVEKSQNIIRSNKQQGFDDLENGK